MSILKYLSGFSGPIRPKRISFGRTEAVTEAVGEGPASPPVRCSACGKEIAHVRPCLYNWQGIYTCDACCELCYENDVFPCLAHDQRKAAMELETEDYGPAGSFAWMPSAHTAVKKAARRSGDPSGPQSGIQKRSAR